MTHLLHGLQLPNIGRTSPSNGASAATLPSPPGSQQTPSSNQPQNPQTSNRANQQQSSSANGTHTATEETPQQRATTSQQITNQQHEPPRTPPAHSIASTPQPPATPSLTPSPIPTPLSLTSEPTLAHTSSLQRPSSEHTKFAPITPGHKADPLQLRESSPLVLSHSPSRHIRNPTVTPITIV